MILSKTVEESDYLLIDEEVYTLKNTLSFLTSKNVKIEIGHDHRFWEYGLAIKALKNVFHVNDQPRIIDVGAGLSLLCPTLSCLGFKNLTEVEPNASYNYDRTWCNSVLIENKKAPFTWAGGATLEKFCSVYDSKESYDVVFCISVIEHVFADQQFLKILAQLVAPGGLLFITTDVVPVMPGRYHFDNLREHNYTMQDISSRIEYLRSIGFKLEGESDLTYHGDKVFNYSFCSLAMVKK